MVKKEIIRLTEQDLHNIVKETINEVFDINAMVRRMRAGVENSKLGIVMKALPNVKWTISGDSGYKCIKDTINNREFRLYDNGQMVFLYGYNSKSGAWGDYANEVKINDIESLVRQPNWYKNLLRGKADTHKPDVIQMY